MPAGRAGSPADADRRADVAIPAKVTPRFGSELSIASDNGYADLDDDALPDLAVGRLPADTPAELAGSSPRFWRMSGNADFGPWRRNVNLVAGLGGFGVLADAAIETAARRIIVNGVPASFTTHITYGNWRSPYCPNPLQFRQAVLESLSRRKLVLDLCRPCLAASPGRRRSSRRQLCLAWPRRHGTAPQPPWRPDRLPAGLLHRGASIAPTIAWPRKCCAHPAARSPSSAVRG